MNMHASYGFRRRLMDTYVNFMSSLGTVKDKAYHSEFTLHLLGRDQLDMAYRGDWVAKKVVNVPAGDATREWRTWKADPAVIEKIEAEEKRLLVPSKLNAALIRSRLYGGSALVMGTRDGQPEMPIDVEKAGKTGLKYLHVLSKHELVAGEINRDITSVNFGLPEYYEVQTAGSSPARVHASRVIRFVGQELPSRDIAGSDGWGDSIIQSIYDAVMNVASSSSGVASMIQESKVDIIKIPKLMASMNDEDYKSRLRAKLALANENKSSLNMLILDKEEEWERIEAKFTDLADIVKLYLLIASGAADIPATRLIGQSAQGLNATGEGDLINYYDSISSFQKNTVTPAMEVLDRILRIGAAGTDDPGIWYEWNPLWQLSDEKKAAVFKLKADTFKVDVDAAILDPTILSKIRLNQIIEDGVYPGIEEAVEEFDLEGAGVDETDGEVEDQFAKQKERQVVQDARPRTLYVRRDVLNAKEIANHYAGQVSRDLLMDPSKWHVTIAYSKTPVDWIKVGSDEWNSTDDGRLTIPPGGARLHERLGKDGVRDAVVLQFTSSRLAYRHEDIKRAGASWDFDDYQPHVIIAWDADDKIYADTLEPWRGKIELGPEIFEEVDENWREKNK